MIFTSDDISTCLLSSLHKKLDSPRIKLIICIHGIDVLTTYGGESCISCRSYPLIDFMMENIYLYPQLFKLWLLSH